jgi:hypothetical protein
MEVIAEDIVFFFRGCRPAVLLFFSGPGIRPLLSENFRKMAKSLKVTFPVYPG